MDGFAFDRGPQLCSQRLVGDQVDRAAHEILDVELNAEKPLRRRWTIEPDKDVDITVFGVLVTCERSEKRNIRHTESPRKGCLVLPKQTQDFISAHRIPHLDSIMS